MAIIIKALSVGNISNTTDTDLYEVPPSKSAVVTSLRLVNIGSYTATTSVKVKPVGDTARAIDKPSNEVTASAVQLIEDPVTLGAGDKIQVTASGTSPFMLDWILSGVERDI